ncbi:MAG: hypothetical protein MJB14_14095 [Spirochaetes bacterium]|nr:hypothetical protein [Spirochaetota bacterium]
MKKILFIIISLLIACQSGADQKEPQNEEMLFRLMIEQDGVKIPPTNHTFVLKRKPFALKFQLFSTQTIYINFNESSFFYEEAIEKSSVEHVIGFGGTGMAEYEGNPDKEIFLSNGGWHVWMVEDGYNGRFDQVVKEGDIFSATRTVNQLYHVDGGKTIELKDVDIIYGVYCNVDYDKKEKDYEMTKFDTFKIIFED